MALNLTYFRNRWNGRFRVSNSEKTVNFLIDSGKIHTLKLPLLINIGRKFDFEGTAPNGTNYTYTLLFSLVYKGNSVLEIQWADGRQDTMKVSLLNSGVLLDVSAKENGLLVILKDGAIGQADMLWEEYDDVD